MRSYPLLAVWLGAASLCASEITTTDPLATFETELMRNPADLRAASEYRQTAIRLKAFDRSVQFFETLVAQNPHCSNAWLNYGFAIVDKIPTAGAITQVILADRALTQFSKSVELSPMWLAYYTRGNSYLFWPKVFRRAQLGVTDLEKAMEIQKRQVKRPYHVRGYISLGDGYWKTDQFDRAQAVWREGFSQFPDSKGLEERLARTDQELQKYLDSVLDPFRRVDTDLREVWQN